MYKDVIVTRKFTTPENYNYQLHKKRATEKAEFESAVHLRSQVISGMISEPLNHSMPNKWNDWKNKSEFNYISNHIDDQAQS